MDERILVEVYVPAAMKSFDIYVPAYKKIFEIKEILFPLLEELSDEVFIPMTTTKLYGERIQVILTDEKTLHEVKLVQGDKIIVL